MSLATSAGWRYQPAGASLVRSSAASPGGWGGALRRAALPLQLQLPRRRVHPEELAEEAARLGLDALALTDHDGFYGVVRFAEAARAVGLPTVFGAELSLGLDRAAERRGRSRWAATCCLLADGPEGYARLAGPSAWASWPAGEGRPGLRPRRGGRRHGGATWWVLTGCRKGAVPAAARSGPAAAASELGPAGGARSADRVVVELWDHGDPLDSARNDALAELAPATGSACVATNNVHYATPAQRPLATALAAVRARRSLGRARRLAAGPPGPPTCARGPRWPGASPAIRAWSSGRRARRGCAFDLALVAPTCPPFPCPPGHTRCAGCASSPRRAPAPLRPADAPRTRWPTRQIDHELDVIEAWASPATSSWSGTSWSSAGRTNILCQGRGSAANSAVCYALGITNVDAVSLGLLFERFLSPERDGPPDIDLDIESDRREEAIQYVYGRYGAAPRRPGGQRHHLPGPLGGAGHGQGARASPPASRTPGASRSTLGHGRGHRGPARPSAAVRMPTQVVLELANGSWRTSPATWASTPGAWSSATARSRCARWSGRGWRTAPSCSGTRTTAPPSAWSSSTCSGWACSRRCTTPSTSSREHHGATGRPGHHPQDGRGLRDAVPGRLGRGVPGGDPGPDGHAAPAPPRSSTTWWSRWR